MPVFIWLILAGVALLLPTAYAGFIGAPYAPTRAIVVKKAFAFMNIGVKDVVVDLGVGDGKILLASAGRGARAWGYELSPILWLIAWLRSLPWRGRVKVKYGNFYRHSLADATIVFAFLMPDKMPRLKAWLKNQSIPNGRFFAAYLFPFKDLSPLHVVREPKVGAIYIYDLKELT